MNLFKVVPRHRFFQYQPEHLAFFKRHVAFCDWEEVTRRFNQTFQTNLTAGSIRRYCNRRGINRPEGTGKFQKGHQAWNRGTKGLIKPNSGSFKPGLYPAVKHLVGTVVLRTSDNYYIVKVAMPDVWRLRSHLVLESAGVTLPKGAIVFHLNGDSTDDRLENLIVISRAEMIKINNCVKTYGIAYKDMPPSLQKTVLLKNRIDLTIRSRQNEQIAI